MKMWNCILWIVFAIVVFLVISDFQIHVTDEGWSFALPGWRKGVGFYLIGLGLSFCLWNAERNAYKKGFNDALETTIKILEEKAGECTENNCDDGRNEKG